MTIMQYAWLIYAAGGLGCCIASWWMFLWAWRFIRYSAVISVMVILFTPYAIDPQTMQMAPAIYTLVFNGMSLGFEAIVPLIKLMTGIWLIGIILALLFVLLTRNIGSNNRPRYKNTSRRHNKKAPKKNSANHAYAARKERYSKDNLTQEEWQAREEMLEGNVPMRAIRD